MPAEKASQEIAIPPGFKLPHALRGHSGPINAIAWSPEGRRIVSASEDGTLRVWGLDAGSELRTPASHTDAFFSVVVTPDGRRAVSASRDGTLKAWDLESGSLLRTLEGHSDSVYAVSLSADG